jgi:kynureninase
MKSKVVLGFLVVLLMVMPTFVEAQNCKPTVSGKDKITKVQTDEWGQILYETGFLASAVMTTSEVNIGGTIARIGDVNTINVVLTKSESNTARAVLESPYKAEKGNEFIFGFKEGGEPLRFTADSVSNNTAADMFGKLNTRVVLTAHLKDDEVLALKSSLANKQIDVVRISLANNFTIDKSIKDKNGKQFAEKIRCFATFLQQKGLIK